MTSLKQSLDAVNERHGASLSKLDDELTPRRLSPALKNLVLAARFTVRESKLLGADDWFSLGFGALKQALAEVDAEALRMGAIAPKSSEDGGLQNISLGSDVQSEVETRKPPITGASGPETPGRALGSADLVGEDRRCKK